jgi:hypothetical protein
VGLTNAPAGFTQDDQNPQLCWGPKIEKSYFLALVWNAEDGVQLHTDVNGDLTLEETMGLGADLLRMSARMKDLS